MNKLILAIAALPVAALTACGGTTSSTTPAPPPSSAVPIPDETVTGSVPQGDAGTLAFGQFGETYSGLSISITPPRKVTWDGYAVADNLTAAQMKKRVNFLQTVVYENQTSAKVNIGGEGVQATVVSTGVECPRVFADNVNPSSGTGVILTSGKRKYNVGFSCAGKPGEQIVVTAWAADDNNQGDDVIFTGVLP